MEKRGQFTFYRSFWEAVQGLPKKDRLPILEAIISYALDGEIPKGLNQPQSAFFSLVKPTLDSARKKAANGKQGGSKPKANCKQTPREKEIEKENEKEEEKENEIEIEVEGEKDKEHPPSIVPLFEQFWENYPDKRDREGAEAAWARIATDKQTAEQIMISLDAWHESAQWQDQGGAYIPMATNWLNKGYWMQTPKTVWDDNAVCDFSETIALYEKLKQQGGMRA